MQFVDNVTIDIESGAGGNGIVSWRREKYEPYGGPAGGDGGKGGDVIIKADNNMNTLLEFKYQAIFRAETGVKGRNKSCHGRKGENLIIKVPCGTVIRDADTSEAIADLVTDGQEAVVATGGRGGRGNGRFASSRRQAPEFCEPGEPGIERKLNLELKMIAEVGIIGLPNAGKSTLISTISAAKPKIADYPFTTLTPNIGVVKKPNGDGILIADIPGLIEGASDGQGLGHEFLRHVERTRVLLHLVDLSTDNTFDESDESVEGNPVQNYYTINTELERYSKRLAKKHQILVLSKTDTVTPEVVEKYVTLFTQITGTAPLTISSATHNNLDELLQTMFSTLERIPVIEELIHVVEDPKATDHDDSHFDVVFRKKTFFVDSGKIRRLFSVTDFKNRVSIFRTLNIIKAMGVYKALEQQGATTGHIVNLCGIEFDYIPDEVPMPEDFRKEGSEKSALQ